MKTQNPKDEKKGAKTATTSKSTRTGAKNLSQKEMEATNGGSIGALNGISSLSGVLSGTAGLDSSSSGSGDGHSYSSSNNNQGNFGFGTSTTKENY